MAIPHVKIRVRGVVAGKLYLLGTEIKKDGAFRFLLSSNGTVGGFIAMCQGMFNFPSGPAERLFAVDDPSEENLLCRARIKNGDPRASASEKIREMKSIAHQIEQRVERQLEQRAKNNLEAMPKGD